MTTPTATNADLTAAIRSRAQLLSYTLQMIGVPHDTTTACGLLNVAVAMLKLHGIPASEVRGYVEQIIAATERAPMGGLSVDAALADAKAHAAKAPGYDGNGSCVP